MSEAHVYRQSWCLPLGAATAAVVTALVYVRGWLRFRDDSPDRIYAWRLAALMSGLFSVWIAIGSPLATLDHRSLTMHMAKHLVLMTVAAPLVLAGAPVLTLLRGARGQLIQSDLLLGSRTVRWLGRSRTAHVLCWLAAGAAVIGWHLPVAFQLGMRARWAHNVEDVCFLSAGLLFWWPVMQPRPTATRSPRWSMAFYLFLATLPCDILSAFLVFCDRVVYHCYVSTTPLFGLSPIQDQECAGALMWVWVTFAYLIPAVAITMQILSPSDRQSSEPRQPEAQTAWTRVAVRPPNGAEAEAL